MSADLNEIAIFATVVRAGSFIGAARVLGQPKSTVSAKVQALERRLGVALLQRTTRRLHLTEAGRSLFDASAKALAELEAAEAAAQSSAQSPRGLLRVTAPLDLGTRWMPGFLRRFNTLYPGIEIDLVVTGRVVDIIQEGIDVAIRASVLKDSTFIAKKITTDRFFLFASPKYLDVAGRPKRADDLVHHQCIRHSRTQKDGWKLTKGNATVEVEPHGPAMADELSVVRELVRTGLGIGLFPAFIAADAVAAGELEPVLPGWYCTVGTLYLVYPAQRFQHPKVKVFVKEASESLEAFFATARD